MNLYSLNFSSKIFLLNILLLFVLIYIIYSKRIDYFVNYGQQVDPMAKPQNNPDIDAANNNYSSLLMFIKSNPSKSVNFIQDIRQKFFDNTCKVKSNIDFPNIAQLPLGVPFS